MAVSKLESECRETDEEKPEADDDTKASPDVTDGIAVLLLHIGDTVNHTRVITTENSAAAVLLALVVVTGSKGDVLGSDTLKAETLELVCHEGFECVGTWVEVEDPAEPRMHLAERNQIACLLSVSAQKLD